MRALEELDAAKLATIDQKERDQIDALAEQIQTLLQAHGIFIGRG